LRIGCRRFIAADIAACEIRLAFLKGSVLKLQRLGRIGAKSSAGPNMREFVGRLAAYAARRQVFLFTTILIAGAGLAMRALWVSQAGRLAPTNSEMFYVSRTFAATGRLADAYGPGAGLTAHVTPIMPVYAGLVYRAFGLGSPAAEIVLIAAALILVGLSLWCLDRVMARLGTPAVARLAGLAAFILLPLNFSLEMQNFRVWEGAVATAGLSAFLLWVLQADGREVRIGWIEVALMAACGGAMALASPPVALAMYGCLGLLVWRRRGFPSVLGAAAISAILLLLISYPWAVRNEGVFGEKVWSRTNFGFNFALGFHDAAVHPADPRKVFLDRLAVVDPFTSKTALAQLQAAGGEQAYSRLWTKRTMAWVSAHPVETLQIAGRHMAEFYLPPRWHWSIYGDNAAAVAPRQAITWAISLLAFLGLLLQLWRRDWRGLYLAAVLALPALPYVLAQPVLRYRYVISALLVFMAADFVWRLVEKVLGSGSTSVPLPVRD
jgi:hypothetical protein